MQKGLQGQAERLGPGSTSWPLQQGKLAAAHRVDCAEDAKE